MNRIGQVAAGDIINRKVRINVQLKGIALLAVVRFKKRGAKQCHGHL